MFEGLAAGASDSSAQSALAGPIVDAALLEPAAGNEQPVQLVQCAKRARLAKLVCPVEAGTPAFSWAPYVGHLATNVGRSGLWCLRCFSKLEGDYRV